MGAFVSVEVMHIIFLEKCLIKGNNIVYAVDQAKPSSYCPCEAGQFQATGTVSPGAGGPGLAVTCRKDSSGPLRE